MKLRELRQYLDRLPDAWDDVEVDYVTIGDDGIEDMEKSKLDAYITPRGKVAVLTRPFPPPIEKKV